MRAAVALLALAVVGAAPAAAQGNLTIAVVAEATSLDPHFHEHDPTVGVLRQVYEFLVGQDAGMRLTPELAESWRAADDLTWEFRLRRGVTFHDGSPFTSRDVAESIRRVPRVPNSPSSFAPYVRPIVALETPDEHTVIVRTATPWPLMPNSLGTVMIVPAAMAEASTADFNAGRAAIGTGPYRVQEYARGQRVVLAAGPAHRDGPPAWSRVTYRPIPQTGARTAALLTGEVDVMEQPSPADLPRLRASRGHRVVEAPGNRVVFFAFDLHRATSPFVTGHDGQPIPNPFLDRRVREAVSLAINRRAIAERVMEGVARPANQFVTPGVFGHVEGLPEAAYDPERARRLLAEAGHPNGFRVALHGTNDRLVNDEQVLQAIAQMLARIGVAVTVEAQPSSVFFARAGRLEYSFFFNSWGFGSSGGLSTMRTLIASFDPDRGMGASNRGRYSNPVVDAAMRQAMATVADAPREALLRQATETALNDVAVVPTHWMSHVWATRAGVTLEPRLDGYTLAASVRPATN